jgi:hypothetical protein
LWADLQHWGVSWSDLERLVTDAETSAELQQALRRCRSRQELLLTACQLGYQVTSSDLLNAWLEHHNAPAVERGLGEPQLQAGACS